MYRRTHRVTLSYPDHTTVDGEGRRTATTTMSVVWGHAQMLSDVETQSAAQQGERADVVLLVDSGVPVGKSVGVQLDTTAGLLAGTYRVTAARVTAKHQRVLLVRSDP